MQRISAQVWLHFLLLMAFFIAMALGISGATANTSDLDGSFEAGLYTSVSARFSCDLSDYTDAEGFFIDDAYELEESDSVTFGFDDGNRYLIWTVRTQKEGRLDKGPLDDEGFPINLETFIPYFYSELPYELQEIASEKKDFSRTGFIKVLFGNQSQRHGYWIKEAHGWLNSIQFLPTLSNSEQGSLELEESERELNAVHQRCVFK